jgi:hypothetical protein
MVWQLFDHLALGESLVDFPKHFPGRVTLEAAREALELGRDLFTENGRNWTKLARGEEECSRREHHLQPVFFQLRSCLPPRSSPELARFGEESAQL